MTNRFLTSSAITLIAAIVATSLVLIALRTGIARNSGTKFSRSEQPFWFYITVVFQALIASLLYAVASYFAIKALP